MSAIWVYIPIRIIRCWQKKLKWDVFSIEKDTCTAHAVLGCCTIVACFEIMDGGAGEGCIFNRGTMYEWKLSEAASAALRQVSGLAQQLSWLLISCNVVPDTPVNPNYTIGFCRINQTSHTMSNFLMFFLSQRTCPHFGFDGFVTGSTTHFEIKAPTMRDQIPWRSEWQRNQIESL